MSNNELANIAHLDQTRELCIRAFANNPVLFKHCGGIVENITPETITDTIVDCMLADKCSPADIMAMVIAVNPVALAESVREFLTSSIYGSDNPQVNEDGTLSDRKFLGEY